jgi:hypothetical protein
MVEKAGALEDDARERQLLQTSEYSNWQWLANPRAGARVEHAMSEL